MPQHFQTLLKDAQAGNEIAAGKLLELYRPFLLQIANNELDPRLKSKVGSSDVVQQSMLDAGASLTQFVGEAPAAFQAWLRRILLNNLANQNRYYRTDKRNVGREVQLSGTDSKAAQIDELLADGLSKSDDLARREELSVVAQILSKMSDDHRLVIQMRNQENRTFAEIGNALGRSTEAARKLWARAIEVLKFEIDKRNS